MHIHKPENPDFYHRNKEESEPMCSKVLILIEANSCWRKGILNFIDKDSILLSVFILVKIKAMVSIAKYIYCKLRICKVHKRNSK